MTMQSQGVGSCIIPMPDARGQAGMDIFPILVFDMRTSTRYEEQGKAYIRDFIYVKYIENSEKKCFQPPTIVPKITKTRYVRAST